MKDSGFSLVRGLAERGYAEIDTRHVKEIPIHWVLLPVKMAKMRSALLSCRCHTVMAGAENAGRQATRTVHETR